MKLGSSAEPYSGLVMCYRSYYWDGPQKFIVGLLWAIDLITGMVHRSL